MSIRFKLLAVGFILAFLSLIARLFYWQIVKGEDLAAQARDQYRSGFTINAPRGDILANDGSWLAATIDAWLLFATPNEFSDDIDDIAGDLALLLVEDPEDDDSVDAESDRIEELISREGARWVPIKSRITTSAKEKIENLNIKGIGFDRQEMRAYPEASSAAHLLGFVGKNEAGEDQGYFGLEGYYDITLKGKQGFLSRDADARGVPILLGSSKEVSAINGVDLQTHIDKSIQLLIEEKLKLGIEKYGATAGTVVVMDPKTGGVLGMVSFPAYDTGNYAKYSDELFTNPAVSSSFEPGSIFKVIIMAAGLDSKAVAPETQCDICTGPLLVDKYTIGTWDDNYYPNSTMTDVIKHSDNVGMAFVGRRLGANRLYDYLTNFGIGEKSGIDLQGEMTPKLREKGLWNEVEVVTASFGQGIAVTPIQMVRAVGAIANQGILVKPQVVNQLIGSDWKDSVNTEDGKRVVSKEAAEQITQMMAEAASNGEAKWTYLRGFKVAGKTGTAQIPIAGHYDAERTIASFIGFAPYDDPKFVMLVMLREPQSSPWAAETAAPLWYSIAGKLFPYFGMQPSD